MIKNVKLVRIYYFTAVLLVTIVSCKPNNTKGETKSKPNVVFIAVDDLRPDLGVYGNEFVQTPNMDKLAQQGVFFTNHYVQVPTCGASRYSLITGLRPRKKSQLGNNIFAQEVANQPEKTAPESFVHQLRRNGYYTVGIGKISHSVDGLVYGYEEEPSTKKEMPHSWDEFHFNSGKWGTGWNAFFGYADGENRQSLKRQVKPYEMGAVDDKGYPDGLTAELAVKKLAELKNKKQSFFLGVGFFKPHLPFNAPKKYWDLYNRETLPLSPNPFIGEGVNQASLQSSGEFNGYQLTDEKAGLKSKLSDDYSRKLVHAYYASISYVDAQIGKVLDEIKALELEENTIVVVWGDHGWNLGDHLVWGKHTLFERSLNSPLIIKVPGTASKNAKIETITETVDIYPTILELCNVASAADIDGESLVASMRNPTLKKEDVAYSYYKNGISMRTSRYRLTKYFRDAKPTIELYDHEVDPYETKNRAILDTTVVNVLMPLLEKGNTGLYGSK
ncbi:sulfatase [Cellulophaga sp. F20128]|uniref:sulfatase n=1 Tax=Cellulophaga sp. F20128 TaxID=2926413 RepID=UPI001FF27128|nr:sulfatase [Cellulophaga sp. F20128]MCK0157585.1 sulfatase [Cellulophaga sp. F20128]